MLLLLSTVLVMVYTILCIIKLDKNKSKLSNMVGMTIVMLFSMASSVLVGLLAGIQFQGNLTLSTIVAICLSIFIGILIGRQINLLALVEGIASGMMGGMMGAMLGEMIPSNNYKIMVVFTDILFIATTLVLIFLINTEARKTEEKLAEFTSSTSKWVITSVIFAFIIMIGAELELEERTVLSKTNYLEESDQKQAHTSHN